MLLAIALTGSQLNLIIAVAVIFAVLFAGNAVLFAVFFYKRKKSELCTVELQQRREQLLEELHRLQLKAAESGLSQEDLDDEEDAVDVDDDEADDEAEDEVENDESAEETEEPTAFNAEIMQACDMPESMRVKYGLVGEEYDSKRYYVRPSYSFKAKLIRSTYDVRSRYIAVANALGGIAGRRTKRSFRQERVSLGRKTLALLLFKGKKLCVALALDPNVYAETKYRGIDVSGKKRFASTPMLLKLTSPRKVDYAIYLVEQLARANSASFDPEYEEQYDLAEKTRDELIASNDVKYTVLGEVISAEQEDDSDDVEDSKVVRAGILAVRDMSGVMRNALNLAGGAYDEKRYYVRYNYSFEAKLRNSDDEVKSRYESILSEAYCYKKLNIRETFRGVRLSVGRKSLGQIFFKGKTLCVALALDPSEYEQTKYRGIDVSQVKRFAATPMLLKLTSDRRLGYAKYLFTKLAEYNNLEPNFTGIEVSADVSAMDINQLFSAGLLKITVIGEAPSAKK